MSFDADITGCAGIVERGDPERFRAIMAAPVAARAKLFPIFAMNVEVARAPWVSQEAMIAEMRLQWWRDALEEIASGAEPRRHEVVTPLAACLSPEMAKALFPFVAARQWDIYRDPFADAATFEAYIDATAGTLLVTAAQALGTAEESVVRDVGYAMGLANWFQAIPTLVSRGRIPLVDGRPASVQALAQSGLERLSRARGARFAVSPDAAPALLSAWLAGPILKQAADDPERVVEGRLLVNPMRQGISLSWRAALRRW